MIKDEDLLLAMYKKEKNPKKKERLFAIYKIIKENLGIAEVARMFLKSYNTIKQWRLRFLEKGTDGPDEIPRSERPRTYNYTKITDFGRGK